MKQIDILRFAIIEIENIINNNHTMLIERGKGEGTERALMFKQTNSVEKEMNRAGSFLLN